MIREGEKVQFTEQDKQNIYIKKYTASELKIKEMQYRKRQNNRRCIFLFILVFAIGVSIFVETVKYPSDILAAFMIFLIVLYEYIDRININAVRRKYYIEILVEEKLQVETIIEQTLTPGSSVTTFYPIRGKIKETNYESIFYIEREEYEKADVGDFVRISMRGEKI